MKSISKLQDGKKGIVFKIVTDDGEEQVIKFQGNPAAKAMLGTEMLEKAGVTAPKISEVKDEGLKNIHEEVKAFMKRAEENSDDESLATAKLLSENLAKAGDTKIKAPFPHVVRMDFASGVTLDQAIKNKESFREMMTNPEFHKQLGKIMGSDAFSANGDRFAARTTGGKLTDEGRVSGMKARDVTGAPELVGWYNKDNLIIEGSGKDLKLKPIDNDFQPGMNVTAGNIFGNEFGWGQHGSIASANPAQFKREIFAVAQMLEKQAGIQLTPQELKDFIENTTNSAKETIGTLLKEDYSTSNVAQKLYDYGETEQNALDAGRRFGEHREAIDLLAGAMSEEVSVKPTVAQIMGIAKETTELTAEKVLKGLGLPADVAKEIAEDREKLAEFNKLTGGGDLERFAKLMKGERGDHVGKDFKLSVKEAALLAKDESTFKQFTQKAPARKL